MSRATAQKRAQILDNPFPFPGVTRFSNVRRRMDTLIRTYAHRVYVGVLSAPAPSYERKKNRRGVRRSFCQTGNLY